jgi:hypothetical protein
MREGVATDEAGREDAAEQRSAAGREDAYADDALMAWRTVTSSPPKRRPRDVLELTRCSEPDDQPGRRRRGASSRSTCRGPQLAVQYLFCVPGVREDGDDKSRDTPSSSARRLAGRPSRHALSVDRPATGRQRTRRHSLAPGRLRGHPRGPDPRARRPYSRAFHDAHGVRMREPARPTPLGSTGDSGSGGEPDWPSTREGSTSLRRQRAPGPVPLGSIRSDSVSATSATARNIGFEPTPPRIASAHVRRRSRNTPPAPADTDPAAGRFETAIPDLSPKFAKCRPSRLE